MLKEKKEQNIFTKAKQKPAWQFLTKLNLVLTYDPRIPL
jgi:hypothetical protein